MQTYKEVNDNIDPKLKREYWDVAFGLQAVDGLKPSHYLETLADEHVEGSKTYEEVAQAVDKYYQENEQHTSNGEADIVSKAIYSILADESFTFNLVTFKGYHRRLFEQLDHDIFHPGEFRTVNITKKEPILNGDTVKYQDYGLLDESLRYDFDEENSIDYSKLTEAERIERIATFTSRIWQVHPFREGNTRTTAVFIEKYLQSLGFNVDNEQFEKHSTYFRNALVRANYNNLPLGITATNEFLILFFENLLLSANHPLDNSSMQIQNPKLH